jgi:tetratricopeptide (TPR) repeat protein
MSENDKWAWFKRRRSGPGSIPSGTHLRKGSRGLHLDVLAADAVKTPAASEALGKAVALHLEGKRDAALKELSAAIQGGDNLVELYTAMGHIEFELHKFAERPSAISKAAQADPKHKTAKYNQGVCLERLERWQDAADAFQKALDIDPKRVEARLGLGYLPAALGPYRTERSMRLSNA